MVLFPELAILTGLDRLLGYGSIHGQLTGIVARNNARNVTMAGSPAYTGYPGRDRNNATGQEEGRKEEAKQMSTIPLRLSLSPVSISVSLHSKQYLQKIYVNGFFVLFCFACLVYK